MTNLFLIYFQLQERWRNARTEADRSSSIDQHLIKCMFYGSRSAWCCLEVSVFLCDDDDDDGV